MVQTSASRKGRGRGAATRSSGWTAAPSIRRQLLLGLFECFHARAGQPERPRRDVDRGQDARQVGLAGDRRGVRERTVEPFEDLEVGRGDIGPGGIARGRDPPDLGKRGFQPDGVIRVPGEAAGESQVIGEAFGPSPLAEDLGERPGFRGPLGLARRPPASRPRPGTRWRGDPAPARHGRVPC